MEFDEMKKIWDTQNNEPLYAINEEALRKRVRAKKNVAGKAVNLTEVGLMFVNGITATILLIDGIMEEEGYFYEFVGATLLLLTVLYIFLSRRKRLKNERNFDRSILGELDHAISNTKSSFKIGSTMIWWYILPMSILMLTKMISQGDPLSKYLLVICGFVLSFFVSQWGAKKHIPKRKQLERLRDKLEEQGVEG